MTRSTGWYDVINPGIAIDHLELIKWVWNKPGSFFAHKKNKSEATQARTSQSYMFRSVWKEITCIRKNKSANEKVSLLKRSHLDKCIKLILDDIILYQARDCKPIVETKSNSLLYGFTIKLNSELVFMLEVQYSINGRVTSKLLATFKNTNSGRYKIAKALTISSMVPKSMRAHLFPDF